jgi:hypothetical protein
MLHRRRHQRDPEAGRHEGDQGRGLGDLVPGRRDEARVLAGVDDRLVHDRPVRRVGDERVVPQVGQLHPDQGGQQVVGGRAGEPDRDPAQHALGDLTRFGHSVVDVGQDLASPVQETLPGRGELHLARRAVEQQHAHLGFEHLDLL